MNICFSIDTSAGSYNDHIDADKELFLWSVITGRRDFALLFWSRAKNKICKKRIVFQLEIVFKRKVFYRCSINCYIVI